MKNGQAEGITGRLGFSSLEQLFGSRTRVKLLNLFLMNSQRPFFVRELTREIGAQINSIRRELMNLEKLGLIMPIKNQSDRLGGLREKKFYGLNHSFILTSELASLFSKARVLAERDLVDQIRNLGNLDYMVLTGFFVGLKIPTDILLVGQIDRRKLNAIIASFEKDLRREINYTLMTTAEFKYRKDITDKFLYDILVNKKIEVIDNINKKAKAA